MTLRDLNWVNGPVPVIDPDYLSHILGSTSDLAFLVSPEGRVMSTLIEQGTEEDARYASWVGRPMTDFLTSESIPKFESALAAVTNGVPTARRIELNHVDSDDWQYPVRYSFHKAGPGNSVLMLGHDLRLAAEAQEQLVQAQVALERNFEKRRAQDARYGVVLSNTTEPFFFVSATDGRITDLNASAAELFGKDRDDLVGASLASEMSYEGDGTLVEALVSTASTKSGAPVDAGIGRRKRAVSIAPSLFRVTGERMLYCRVMPAEMHDPKEERLAEHLGALYLRGAEAVAFTTMQGVILEANDAFLELIGAPALDDARNRSIADFLQRGQVDLGVILEHVRRAGRLRMYSTRLTSDFGQDTVIDLSATLVGNGNDQVIAIVVRDAERAEIIRRGVQPANQSEAPNQSVVELVGSATLKEIVAETNDVIEKICIETAVELTKNNRAAAAEMLGLSRQSLYVKLRKYGLQKSSGHD